MSGNVPHGEHDKLSHEAESAVPVAGEALLPGDTYMDGPYLVFTAQYHLRRGSCCHSDCRHCPYGAGEVGLEDGAPEPRP